MVMTMAQVHRVEIEIRYISESISSGVGTFQECLVGTVEPPQAQVKRALRTLQ